jgi:hypothetical protein
MTERGAHAAATTTEASMERDEVLQRLRAWTTLVDPASGEPLPLAHALRHGEVQATLCAAVALLEARSSLRPRNAGRAWSTDDDAKLAELFDRGTGVAHLAEELERTRGSVTARLVKLGKIEPTPGMGLRY